MSGKNGNRDHVCIEVTFKDKVEQSSPWPYLRIVHPEDGRLLVGVSRGGDSATVSQGQGCPP